LLAHLQAAQPTAQIQSLQKSQQVSSPKRILKFFADTQKKKIKTPNRQQHRTMTRKLNTDNGLQTQGSRTPAFNMVFAASGVSVPHRTVRCGYESLYLRSSVSAETPRQRKYPNRYGQFETS